MGLIQRAKRFWRYYKILRTASVVHYNPWMAASTAWFLSGLE